MSQETIQIANLTEITEKINKNIEDGNLENALHMVQTLSNDPNLKPHMIDANLKSKLIELSQKIENKIFHVDASIPASIDTSNFHEALLNLLKFISKTIYHKNEQEVNIIQKLKDLKGHLFIL